MHPTQTDDREQPTGDRWSPTVQAANRRPQRLQDRFDRVEGRRRAVLGPESVADPIYLEPGQHELCLQVSDGEHTALDITDTVTVDVEVENLQQWCSVVGEMDAMFESVDNSDDDLATKQVGYENIRRLAAQAADGIDHGGPPARDDFVAALTFAADLSAALTTADSPEAVEAASLRSSKGFPTGCRGPSGYRSL